MTDFAGSDEPTRSDEQDIDGPTPIIPIAPGAAGVVAVPVTRLNANPEEVSPDLIDDEDEPSEHVEHHGSIGDAIRGLLGRDKFR